MKLLVIKLLVGTATLVVIGVVITLVSRPNHDENDNQSASHVAYSFAHAISHSNFGRACSHFSHKLLEDNQATYEGCRVSYAGVAGQGAFFFGKSPYADSKIVGKPVVKGGSVSFKIKYPVVGTCGVLTLRPNKNGDHKIVKIGDAKCGKT